MWRNLIGIFVGVLAVFGIASTPAHAQITGWVSLAGAAIFCDASLHSGETTAINNFLNANKGSTILIPPGRYCVISGSNLSVPDFTTIEGTTSPLRSVSVAAGTLQGSGFLLDYFTTPLFPATVKLGTGSVLRNLGVWRYNLSQTPSPSDVVSAVNQWYNEYSVGITVPSGKPGAVLDGLFVEGFHICIKSVLGVIYLRDIETDCPTSVYLSNAGDNTYIDKVRNEPFYGGTNSVASRSWERLGTSFYVASGSTGAFFKDLESEGWPMAFVTMESGVKLVGMTAEYPASWHAGTNGVCMHVTAHSAGGELRQISCGNGFADGIVIDESPNTIQISDTNISLTTGTALYFSGGTSTPTIFSVGGTPTLGDVLTLTIASSFGSIPISYAIQPGDVPTDVAAALAYLVDTQSQILANSRINADLSLGVTSAVVSGGSGYANGTQAVTFTGGIGTSATATCLVTGGVPGAITITSPGSYVVAPTGISLSGGSGLTVSIITKNVVVPIFWPADATVSVTASTSVGSGTTLTSVAGTGIAAPGSSGMIRGTDVSGTNSGALFTLGNSRSGALAWSIRDVFTSNGTVTLPSNWLTFGSSGLPPSRLYVSGIQWSSVATSNLGATGGTGASVAGNSYDNAGYVTTGTGTGSTSFTLSFRTVWPTTPHCVVSGAPFSSVAVTTASLSVSGTSSTGTYSYQCEM